MMILCINPTNEYVYIWFVYLNNMVSLYTYAKFAHRDNTILYTFNILFFMYKCEKIYFASLRIVYSTFVIYSETRLLSIQICLIQNNSNVRE